LNIITADKLALLTNVPTAMLKQTLGKECNDYNITGSKFLGLTNGMEFCYHIVHVVKGGTDSAKLFLRYDPTADQVIGSIG
jgi:hypothetical protein